MTVETESMSLEECARLALHLYGRATPDERTQTLILLDENGTLDAFLEAAGSEEEQFRKAGAFTQSPQKEQRRPTVTAREVEQAEHMSDKDLKSLLESKGML